MPTRSARRLIVLGLFLSLHGGGVAAQEDRPRLLLNTDGPVGSVTALVFSSDSRQLFAAGTGKSVHRWTADPEAGFGRAVPATPLHWEIARAERGAVYSLAFSPADPHLAMAGYSTRGASGDIVIYDPSRQEVVRLLPRVRPDEVTPQNATGHRRPVVDLAYSPDGRRLASISQDGEVRLWTAPDWSSRVLRPSGAWGYPQPIAFIDGRRLVVPRNVDAGRGLWSLEIHDVDTRRRTFVSAEHRGAQAHHQGGVGAIVADPRSGRFATSDAGGNLFVWDRIGRLQTLESGTPGTVRSLTFLPGGRLGVMRALPRPQAFEIWSLPDQRAGSATLVQQISLESDAALDAITSAVSDDGKWLAVTAANGDDVWIYPLDAPELLRSQERTRLFGQGSKVTDVRFSRDRDGLLRVTTAQDPAGIVFDLADPKLVDGGEAAWQPPSGGDRLTLRERAGVDTQTLEVFEPGQNRPRCRVSLQKLIHGEYVSHCWLADAEGTVDALAVGTTRSAIYVFALGRNGGDCPLLRYYRDHSNRVTSLSVSRDGRYLASGSWDQTSKIWSLAGLRSGGTETSWGGAFQVQNDRVVITSLLGAGILSHRDMRVGDVIRSAVYAHEGGQAAARNPNEILAAVRDRPLWETFLLEIERDGEILDQPIVVTPAWEPVLTLFVARNGEWALWTPQGVYDSSVNGDELFGWQINRGRDARPAFYRAEQFREELEKPDVIRRILEAGSLAEATALLQQEQAPPLGTLAAQLPALRLESPLNDDFLDVGEDVAIRAEVVFPPGQPPENYVVEAYVNQSRAGEPQHRVEDGRHLYQWEVPPPDRKNRVLVRVRRRDAPAEVAHFVDAQTLVRSGRESDRLRIHLLAVAGQEYATRPLRYPHKDVDDFREFLESASGEFYDLGIMKILRDEPASGLTKTDVDQGVREFLDRLSSASADDLVVVFVAGHGVAVGSRYFYIPPDPGLSGFDPAIIERLGTPWETFRQITDLPCRKLFLLDTCYSGNAAAAEKQAVRSLKKQQAIVFAATSVGEAALDRHPHRENALFTGFLLEGMAGKADGVVLSGLGREQVPGVADGKVDLVELVSFVTASVKEYLPFQRPTCTPIHLLDFADLPLVPVER